MCLAETGGEGDDLARVGFLEPPEDNAGIETARKGEDDFFDQGVGVRGHAARLAGGARLAKQRHFRLRQNFTPAKLSWETAE